MAPNIPTPAILVTGAASGLGAEFLRYYLDHSEAPLTATDIEQVAVPAKFSDRVQTYSVNVASEQDVADLALSLKEQPISLLIHCAGVRGLVPSIVQDQSGDVAAAETLEAMTKNAMMQTLEINSFGTFSLIRAMLPNLLLASLSTSQPPKCIVLGSRMGSLSANVAGGGYAYRASKAALNAIVKSFSIDVPDIAFAVLHPGRVETRLVAWKEDGAMSARDSVRDCAAVIETLTIESSGQFCDRLGVKIEW
jgi:NAD(P)-dependent dehydrogenase (short-subunit alcohol dehydrogenase family)